MDFFIAAMTDKGVKRPTNQDSLFAKQFMTECGKYAFAVLCDGMGGLQHGELASASIVSAFSAWAGERLPTITKPLMDHEIRKEWTGIIRVKNQELRTYGLSNGCKLGSTVTALLLSETRFFILNIGDTRAYELHGRCRQLTVDHTVIADEVSMGNMTQEQAEFSPMRSVLTRCVGVYDNVYPDMFFGDAKLGAVYLLCSDGFRHCISVGEMAEYLMPGSSDPALELRRGEEELIDMVKKRGEKDNISAVAIYAGL